MSVCVYIYIYNVCVVLFYFVTGTPQFYDTVCATVNNGKNSGLCLKKLEIETIFIPEIFAD